MANRKPMAYAHRCPSCGTAVAGRDIDTKTVATGIITCPHCQASGRMYLQVLASEELSRIWSSTSSGLWRPPLQ